MTLRLLGLSIEDIASLLGIIGTLCGAIFYLFRVIVVTPMRDENRNLSNALNALTHEFHAMRENEDREHKDIDAKLHEHDIKIARHDEELKTLFKTEKDN